MRGRRLARKLARVAVTVGGGAAFTGGAGADGAYVRGPGCSRSIRGGLCDRQRGRGDRDVAVVAADRGARGVGAVVAGAGGGDLGGGSDRVRAGPGADRGGGAVRGGGPVEAGTPARGSGEDRSA